MERSGWDDDERGAVPPPSQRAWRHPSELGNHGFTGATARRATRGQFALAVAAGAVGSLTIAALAVVVTGNQMRTTSGAVGRSDLAGTLTSAVAGTTLLSSVVTYAVDPADTVDTTVTLALTGTTVPVPVPPVLNLRRAADAGGEPDDRAIAAVVVDATTLLAEPDDVAGIERFEAALPDGSTVSVLRDGTDPSSGLARLRTRGSIAVAVTDGSTWLGVRCSDESTVAIAADATGDPTPTTPTPSPTPAAVSSTVRDAASPTSADRGATSVVITAVVATRATTTTAAAAAALDRSSTTRAASPTSAAASPTGSVVATTDPVSARAPAAPTVAPTVAASTVATTEPAVASSRPVVVAAPGPTTTAPSPGPSAPPPPVAPTVTASTVVPAGQRVVHVRDVVDGSPAAVAGLRAGDLIISVDGRRVRSMWSLVLAVRSHAIGDTVTVEVHRDGATVTFPVVLGPHPGAGT